MRYPKITRLWQQIVDTEERLTGSLITSGARAPAEQEDYHVVGAAGEPSFQNGFTSHTAAGFGAVRFWKTSNGWVHLAGVALAPAVAGSSTLPIFTLPAGYRPPFEQYEANIAGIGERSSLWTTAAVDPAIPGSIRIIAHGRAGAGNVSGAFPFIFAVQTACIALDGISFRIT